MRKTLVALMVLPVIALAQAPNKDKDKAGQWQPDPERAQKRMRLARTLGLAEALDLDTPQALKLGDTLAKFDDKRAAARKQAGDARDLLRGAARPGGKATAADVDGAVGKLLDARAQLQALDKEMLQAITRDLSPEKKARAALFLGTFRDRIERHVMGPGRGGPGMMGPGQGPWMHRGGGDGPRPQGMMGSPGAGDQLAGRVPGGYDESEADNAPPFAEEEF
jgi:hypothetical protein